MSKPIIVVFTKHFTPGFKGGGPIQSILYLTKALGDHYEFRVICHDRDYGEKKPYENIYYDEWNDLGFCKVFYLAPDKRTCSFIRRLIGNLDVSLYYLNSYFDPVMSIKPLLLRYFKLIPKKHLLIAPRGEFSQSAMSLKAYKKRPWLWIGKKIGLLNGVSWHFTGEHEARDAQAILRKIENSIILSNLSMPISATINEVPDKKAGELKVCVIGRISIMKNPDYALNIFKDIVDCNITVDFYGLIEDLSLYDQCINIKQSLPKNIKINFLGSVEPQTLKNKIATYHLSLLPSRGENFGHAIRESLMVGCPVLISDRTPWNRMEEKGIGHEISLSSMGRFSHIIKLYCSYNKDEYLLVRNKVIDYVSNNMSQDILKDKYKQFFNKLCFQNN